MFEIEENPMVWADIDEPVTSLAGCPFRRALVIQREVGTNYNSVIATAHVAAAICTRLTKRNVTDEK